MSRLHSGSVGRLYLEKISGKSRNRKVFYLGKFKKRRLTVTGASGLLGAQICLLAKHRWQTTAFHHQTPFHMQGVRSVCLDLTDKAALEAAVASSNPHLLIHTAAQSNPELCELHPEKTERLNADVPCALGKISLKAGIRFIFTSTDLVFNGKEAPYRESDRVDPISVYGRQKVRAEQGIAAVNKDALICRIPLMFGCRTFGKPGFFEDMIKAKKGGKPVRLFTDEYRTPLSNIETARGLLLLANGRGGKVHFGSAERISRYEFGCLVRDTLGLKDICLMPCHQSDIKLSTLRPADVSLDISLAKRRGFMPRPLCKQINEVWTSWQYNP